MPTGPYKLSDIDEPTKSATVADGAAPEEGNAVQRAFDKLTTVTPEQEAGHSWLTNKAQEFGAGAIQGAGQPFVHPLQTLEGVGTAIAHPFETAKSTWTAAKEHPAQALGNLVGMADTAGAGEAAASPLLEKLPSLERAGKTFQSINTEAKDVPVAFERTAPELQRFMELTQRGGRNSKPFTQLSRRLQLGEEAPAPMEPVKFPEGRDFYSNIGDAAHQTPLQNLMGRGMKPTMRRQAVNVRRAFNEDLTSAADRIGRGQDYSNAMKEYANAKTLQKVKRGALLLGAGDAARRTGLLGNWIHRTALQQ